MSKTKINRDELKMRLFDEDHALVSIIGAASSAKNNNDQGEGEAPNKNKCSEALDRFARFFHRGGSAPYSAVGICLMEEESTLVLSFGKNIKQPERNKLQGMATVLINLLKRISAINTEQNDDLPKQVQEIVVSTRQKEEFEYFTTKKNKFAEPSELVSCMNQVPRKSDNLHKYTKEINNVLNWYDKYIISTEIEKLVLRRINDVHTLEEQDITKFIHVEQNAIFYLRNKYQDAKEFAIGLCHENLRPGNKNYDENFVTGCCAICTIEFNVLHYTGITVYRSMDYPMNFPPKMDNISQNMDNEEKCKIFTKILIDRVKLKWNSIDGHVFKELGLLKSLISDDPEQENEDKKEEVAVAGDVVEEG